MEAVKDDDNNHVSVNDVDDKAVAAKYIIYQSHYLPITQLLICDQTRGGGMKQCIYWQPSSTIFKIIFDPVHCALKIGV